jgi:hypothetical protein
MKRATRLEGTTKSVNFDKNTMYIEQEFEPNTFQAKSEKSIISTDITFFIEDLNPEVTLDSRGYSLIDDGDRETILAMYGNPDDVYTLTYNDGTTDTVMFRLDKPPDFKKFSLDDCYFTATIYLARIK